MPTLKLPDLKDFIYVTSVISNSIESNQKLAIVTTATVLLYSTYKLLSVPDPFKNGTKQIPCPAGSYPYIGHMWTMNKNYLKSIMDWHRIYGPIIHIKMGMRHWLFIDDPQIAHKVFVNHGTHSSSRPQYTSTSKHYGCNGRGILSAPYGHSWKKTRAAALSMLAPKKLDGYADVIDNEASELVNRLISSSEKEGEVSPMSHLELTTLNFMFLSLFGHRFESIDDPAYREIVHLHTGLSKLITFQGDLSSFLPALSFLTVFNDRGRQLRSFCRKVRDPIITREIEEALKREGPNLVKAVKEGEFDLDPEDEIVFFTDLILGGTDTTASTLSWVLAILCHHPEVQNRIYKELNLFSNKHHRLPRYNERKETPFIVSVMRECMRYRPSIYFNIPHHTTKDIIVDGYFIPKDTTIGTSLDSMNRNPTVYSNPEEFIPDRFIDNDKSMTASANGKIEERDHYLFGWGRRICPGIYLSELELFAIFTNLLFQCTIHPSQVLPDLTKPSLPKSVSPPSPYTILLTRREVVSLAI
ncbi:cytochrome P450 [Pilobolus umbonatus]|nr:cytochrome P450 [Pilobolus umbonatus]